jgi:SAM-dependent methyltransferase
MISTEINPNGTFPVVKVNRKITVAEMKAHPRQIWDVLPPRMDGLTQADADYHFRQRQQWIELNQVDAPRNLAAHARVIDLVGQSLRPGAVILELGGGVGYDAKRILARSFPMDCYLFSEISVPLLQYVAAECSIPDGTPLVFCALDADDLMIAAEQVDVILMISALHHLPRLWTALAEMERVAKPGAHLIFGIEPSRFWSQWLVRLRSLFRPLFPAKTHSTADEECEGFSMADFRDIARRTGWRLEAIQPVWLTCGFIHYGLEFFFRVLRLKKRIRLPAPLEQVFITLDEWLLHIPALQPYAWHYTVSYRKPEKG